MPLEESTRLSTTLPSTSMRKLRMTVPCSPRRLEADGYSGGWHDFACTTGGERTGAFATGAGGAGGGASCGGAVVVTAAMAAGDGVGATWMLISGGGMKGGGGAAILGGGGGFTSSSGLVTSAM